MMEFIDDRGTTIVIHNGAEYDLKKKLLVENFYIYSRSIGREIRVVFFNGEPDEIGAAFYFKRRLKE